MGSYDPEIPTPVKLAKPIVPVVAPVFPVLRPPRPAGACPAFEVDWPETVNPPVAPLS